jgi:hypothetical protein
VDVDHLRREREPLRLEVVSLVDQHGLVLPARDLSAIDRRDHRGDARRQPLRVVGDRARVRRGNVVGAQHPVAPRVEGAHLHALLDAAPAHRVLQSTRDSVRVAQHEDGLRCRTRHVLRAEREDQRLARAGNAANDAMAVAEAARKLLLVQVHHFQEAVVVRRRFVERQRNLPDTKLGEEQSAQAVELRQGHRRACASRHHRPELRSERVRVGALRHLVPEHAAIRRPHLAQVALLELPPRDVREHHAGADGQDRPPFARMMGRKSELRIAFDVAQNVERVPAHLLERALFAHRPARRQQIDLGLSHAEDRIEPPVLHLQHQDALCRMNDHEVRMTPPRPDRDVVPDAGVLFEEIVQPLGHAQLAARVEAGGA